MTTRRTAIVFFAIVIAAFVLQTVIFPTTMVGGDEGRYALDALRIGNGEIPVADYTTRTPVLLFLMFLSTKLFGLGLFSLRLPVMLFSALTAGVVFLLGKELYSRKVGLFSAGVYLLSPMVLWSSQLIKSENLAVLLVSVGTLFLIRGIKNGRWYWFVLAGLSSGVAYIERQSAVSFLVLTALVLLWLAWRRREGIGAFIQYSFWRGLAVFGGFLLGFLPIFLCFFFLNRESATELWLSLFLVNAALAPQGIAFSVYQFSRGWALTFVEAIATQGWVLYFGTVSFATLVAQRIFGARFWKIGGTVVFLMLAVPFYVHVANVIADWDFAPVVFVLTAIGGTLFWLIALHGLGLKNNSMLQMMQLDISSAVIVSWLVSVFLVYLVYTSGYTREFLVPLSLASGVIVSAVFSLEKNIHKGIVVVSLIILWVAGAVWFKDPRTGGWWWNQETVAEAAGFIREHTEDGEVVFTASALPVLFAEREVYKNLNPYAIMLAPDEDTGWGTQPSPRGILVGLQENPPNYVVYDGRMERNLIKKTNNVELETFLRKQYESVARFGSGHRQDWIEVWEKQ